MTNYPKAKRSDIDLKIMQSGIKYIADKHSKGFKKSVLYGLNIAKDFMGKKKVLFLLEGQGDVWRMHEAGFKNSVSIFGSSISDDQLLILEQSGALNLIILTDYDDAGKKAAKQIVKKCGRRFNYYRPEISKKDVGEMTIEQIHEEIKPKGRKRTGLCNFRYKKIRLRIF